jgi:hypothetical protein
MPLYVRPIPTLVFLLPCSYVVWAWITSSRPAKKVPPEWRTRAGFVGLCSVTFSTVFPVSLFVHASFTGGYPFYHPVELFCIRFGFLAALLGLVASIIGKGKLRLHGAAISTLNLLFWCMDATAQ